MSVQVLIFLCVCVAGIAHVGRRSGEAAAGLMILGFFLAWFWMHSKF